MSRDQDLEICCIINSTRQQQLISFQPQAHQGSKKPFAICILSTHWRVLPFIIKTEWLTSSKYCIKAYLVILQMNFDSLISYLLSFAILKEIRYKENYVLSKDGFIFAVKVTSYTVWISSLHLIPKRFKIRTSLKDVLNVWFLILVLLLGKRRFMSSFSTTTFILKKKSPNE